MFYYHNPLYSFPLLLQSCIGYGNMGYINRLCIMGIIGLPIWVWVKIRYPNNWMVNTKLDIHICGPINGLPFWPTSIYKDWWLIPLSKWVITPVISGLTLLIPFITGVITHLLSGMSHQVYLYISTVFFAKGRISSVRWTTSLRLCASRREAEASRDERGVIRDR